MKLKFIRRLENMSQRELGLRVGCTQGFISHLEVGRNKPSKKMKRQLAEIFQIPEDELFDDKSSGLFSGQDRGGADVPPLTPGHTDDEK
jgi:transcriptional regulator with XRE-family HTH domain